MATPRRGISSWVTQRSRLISWKASMRRPRVWVVFFDDSPEASQLEHLGDEFHDAIGGIGVGGADATVQRRDVHTLQRSRLEGAPLGHDELGDSLLIEPPGAFTGLGIAFEIGGAEFGDGVAEQRTLALEQRVAVILAQSELVAQCLVAGLIERLFGGPAESDQTLSALMPVAENVGLLPVQVDAHAEAAQFVVPMKIACWGDLRINVESR